ncbi:MULTISPECIES: peptidylprolyl isomerase [Psychrobacter]|uniref:peptidylprolyl isomerase n=1 Tax=Psychrobacter TaxID=497 RepID=UPI00086E1725|nr:MULTISPECIES: peptidylprolyl isomerase [Psychrobacter]MBA6243885.1 peptidylprolyl isomerase [Psychrobacter sp. Urea-trap-18]MBA6285468.1 peptidylprolyl isomerase [Psychrobacter sp. Urea-trap-16]MBA6319012.1 peptidylprolyl isomerase [Psychrobacter sp. Urea-trap-20]MBA6335031.1 peptidylprolyl isomerase [Psychrobacter sp. Urea-trap-19]OEH69265.1 MAG: peptidylprolyl isomerase [Psychrobacter sp. B29-1]
MRFFSLRQTSRAVLLSMAGLTLALSANAATVKPAAAQASTSAAQNSVDRLTPANSTDGIIALVNDNAILKSELVDAIEQTQARAKTAGEPIANSAQLQSEVLNALILRELQLSMVKRAGLSADEAEINQRLGQIAQAEGLNSIAALQQRLDAAQPGSYANLRAKLIEEASIQALQQRQITRRVRISEQDIDAFLASPEAKRLNQSEYQTIHVRVPYIDDYSRLSAAQREEALKVAQALRTRLLEPNVNVAEAVAASQGSYPIPLQGGDMGFHKAASLPTELSSKITKLDVGTVSEPLLTPEGIDIIKLADKKASNTMLIPQWHTRHILVKVDDLQTDALAEQKINDLYEQLRGGADFASLASTYSDDPGSAGRGGDLDWVSEEDMVGPFEATMKNTAVGDYSAPFKTQFGWHILKVDGKRDQDISEQYRRNMARQALYQRLAPQAQEDWLQELRAGAYIQILG